MVGRKVGHRDPDSCGTKRAICFERGDDMVAFGHAGIEHVLIGVPTVHQNVYLHVRAGRKRFDQFHGEVVRLFALSDG